MFAARGETGDRRGNLGLSRGLCHTGHCNIVTLKHQLHLTHDILSSTTSTPFTLRLCQYSIMLQSLLHISRPWMEQPLFVILEPHFQDERTLLAWIQKVAVSDHCSIVFDENTGWVLWNEKSSQRYFVNILYSHTQVTSYTRVLTVTSAVICQFAAIWDHFGVTEVEYWVGKGQSESVNMHPA